MPWMPPTQRPRGAASAQLPYTAPWRRSRDVASFGPSDRSRPVAVAPQSTRARARAHTHTHTHTHTDTRQAINTSNATEYWWGRTCSRANAHTETHRRYPTRDSAAAGEHTRTIVLVPVIPAGLLLAPQLGPPLRARRIGATASLQKPVLPRDKRGREVPSPPRDHPPVDVFSEFSRGNFTSFCGGVEKRKTGLGILCPPRALDTDQQQPGNGGGSGPRHRGAALCGQARAGQGLRCTPPARVLLGRHCARPGRARQGRVAG